MNSQEGFKQQGGSNENESAQERRERLVKKFADIRLGAKDYLDKAEKDYQYVLVKSQRISRLGDQNSAEAERRREKCEEFLGKIREEVALLEKLPDEALGKLDDAELEKVVRAAEGYIDAVALQGAVINTYRDLPFAEKTE